MRIGLAAAVLVAVGSVAGCTGGAAQDSAPIIAPQGPGEQAQTLSPDDIGTERWTAPSEADLAYVAKMIRHHEQALEMTALAPDRAQHEAVRGLAARIHDTQGPEARAMESWRDQFAAQAPAHGHSGGLPHVDHASMPGMATPEQLAALRAAGGADFDRLFLQLMIAHHEGAMRMAVEVLTTGSDVRVEEMATDVLATQTDEVERMKAIRIP
ncbi:DUF305 domain-containing protein [Saccharothrix coeruleofusca]|uniref:Lipoprotein n=1 Tax=Saccharothrix coeruleofusca TaxID=33919 RepID=A0A918ANW6_9PSEU|nr:DUF305 domain-containing protein [Saccharothrix coeruleofusca]MBP2337158.1 uncharacterized protein (DUF305 family) [Saccharothrix coeruleofusca]GGP66710.1 lipoprotein [Saccharothrix coeruleofusca]